MTAKSPKKTSREITDWHPADIKAALHKRGITLSGIAEANGLNSSSFLSVALVRSAPAGELYIAAALGLHPKDIWPSRYNTDGSRKPQGIRALKFNAVATPRNGKLQAAA